MRTFESRITLPARFSSLIAISDVFGYEIRKVDLTHCSTDTKDIPTKKGGSIGYDGYKKGEWERNECPGRSEWSPACCNVSSAYVHDPQLYESTFEAFEIPAFEIPGVLEAPIISADPAYDSREIQQDNWKRRIKSNLPVNWRSRKHPSKEGNSGLITNSIRSELISPLMTRSIVFKNRLLNFLNYYPTQGYSNNSKSQNSYILEHYILNN